VRSDEGFVLETFNENWKNKIDSFTEKEDFSWITLYISSDKIKIWYMLRDLKLAARREQSK